MIRIVTDTLSCIPPTEAKSLGLYYLPQIIVFGNEAYRDDSEMDSISFLKKAATSSVFPKTSAPQPYLYAPIYKEIEKNGDTALVLCPSGSVSGTYERASAAALDFPNAAIHIIDTRLLAVSLGDVVRKSLEWIKQGLTIEQISQNVYEMAARNQIYFLVNTLDFLYRGGRIGRANAIIGSLLEMKPILAFRDGVIEPVEKQRTHKKAYARFLELITSECPKHENAHLSVLHGDAQAEADNTKAELTKLTGIQNIPITFVPPAILVHSGPGVIGASFFID
jgi:DegV family protein with EDD domain